jgi:hypothetical protein
MKIRPVETKFFHPDRRTDGRTDMTKLKAAFCNFAFAPKNANFRSLLEGEQEIASQERIAVYLQQIL